MRVIVTGSSGFIGQHLARLLGQQGHEVLGLDRRPPAHPMRRVAYRLCDILNASQLEEVFQSFAPEIVLHLAARTDLEEKRDLCGYAANIAGVENIATVIRRTRNVRRAICTSSQLVCHVGYRPAGDQDYQPTTLYGESKVLTEKIWREHEGGGVEWCLVRPTTIWGPEMNPHYLRLFQMIRDGRYFHVGRARTYKSYGYVGNTVHQYQKLMDAPAEQICGRVFYLADYEPIALEEWTEAFQRALDAPAVRSMPRAVAVTGAKIGDLVNGLGVTRFPFNSFRLNNVLTPYQFDLSATRQVCGTLPHSMQEGVAETVQWLRRVWQKAG